jgi:hypothetical protein
MTSTENARYNIFAPPLARHSDAKASENQQQQETIKPRNREMNVSNR